MRSENQDRHDQHQTGHIVTTQPMYPKRRAASFSKGTTLPPERLLSRQRSQTLPTLETQYVSRRALRSRLYMADDMSEIITQNMIPSRGTDGLRIPLQDWLNHPMLITDEQVARIISIELSTKSSPKLDSGSVAYFRSWPMEASQLSQIVDELRKSGYGDVVDIWALTLRSCRPTTTVTVRYVGTTSAPRNPFRRVQKHSERPQSFFGMFLFHLDRLFPQVSGLHKMYVIHGSHVNDFDAMTENWCVFSKRFYTAATDHVERCMISFFGFRTLLNRQRGGKHRMLSPGFEERKVFTDCKTHLLDNITKYCTPPPQAMVLRTQGLFNDW